MTRWWTQVIRSARCIRDDEGGFSLVEVLASIVVFALVAGASTAMLITAINGSRLAKYKTGAIAAASKALEMARQNAIDPNAWSGTGSVNMIPPATWAPGNVTVGNTTYTVSQTTSWQLKSAPAGACNGSVQGGSSNVQPVLYVTETVRWPAMGNHQPVTQSAIFVPPPTLETAGDGAISIKVVDHANNGVSGVQLTVSGPTSATVTTDQYGCALAAFLTPGGPYTVTASKATYVDGQELQNPVQNLGSLSANSVVNASFLYDQASTLATSFSTMYPVATGLPVTVYNSGIAGDGTFSPITATTPLFPYSSYNVWSGVCPEANPNAVSTSGTPLYSPPPLPTTVPMVPTQQSSIVVPTYPLTINVIRQSTGLPVSGAALTATETPYAGAKYPCTTTNTYGLVSSDTSGSSVTGISLGAFKVKATVTISSRTYTGTATVNMTPAGATATVAVS